MAILTKPANNEAFALFDLSNEEMPPPGTYAATIIKIVDKMGVERTKFQSKETETVDLTAFLFGFRGTDGKQYKIDTRPMKISGHPKAALYKFLTALLGHAPAYGWDYMELKGTRCLLTVAHMESDSGTVYASITAAVPLPAGFAPAPTIPSPAQTPPPEIRLADDEGEEIPF
jgi:hypothetical protein